MVENSKKVLSGLELKYGSVSLFALVQPSGETGWTIVVGADWVTEDDKDKISDSIIDLIVKYFTAEEKDNLARIAPFNTSQKLIQYLRSKGVSQFEDDIFKGQILKI